MIKIDGKLYTLPPSNSVAYALIHAKLLDLGLRGANVNRAFATMEEWIELPGELTKTEREQKALKSVFLKEFGTLDEFVRAVAGHTLAAANRVTEERLAFAVLEHLEKYEAYVLDPLLAELVRRCDDTRSWRSYYKEAATLNFEGGLARAVERISQLEPLDRLYQKVAFIHDYCRNVSKLSTPHRDEHAAMRLKDDKWTLNESDHLVRSDRAAGVSVWAGTSGSAMDMIFLAQKVGLDARQLTALAWCIMAFFHFMPTVVSPTHTFHEVMRGAKKIIGQDMVDYDPAEVALPEMAFHTRHLGT